MRKSILIRKASGHEVPFSVEKLRRSLRNAGAEDETIKLIVRELEPQLHDGMTTGAIYNIAFDLLRKEEKPVAAKYRLKQAIMELGPSGFPFEKFIGEILRKQGYSVQVARIVMGDCVKHEVDVIAEKGNNHFMIECKYHNTRGNYCDVKIPLYIYARFQDVEKQWKKAPGHETRYHQGWVVTNTKFTTDAIQYGTCVGMNLVGWNYPAKGSLRDQIDSARLYPVTCLASMTKSEKQVLLDNGNVLCMDICDNPALLKEAGISGKRSDIILREARALCKGEEQ